MAFKRETPGLLYGVAGDSDNGVGSAAPGGSGQKYGAILFPGAVGGKISQALFYVKDVTSGFACPADAVGYIWDRTDFTQLATSTATSYSAISDNAGILSVKFDPAVSLNAGIPVVVGFNLPNAPTKTASFCYSHHEVLGSRGGTLGAYMNGYAYALASAAVKGESGDFIGHLFQPVAPAFPTFSPATAWEAGIEFVPQIGGRCSAIHMLWYYPTEYEAQMTARVYLGDTVVHEQDVEYYVSGYPEPWTFHFSTAVSLVPFKSHKITFRSRVNDSYGQVPSMYLFWGHTSPTHSYVMDFAPDVWRLVYREYPGGSWTTVSQAHPIACLRIEEPRDLRQPKIFGDEL